MSYKDIKIQKSYISCGDDNIATAFVTPMLKQAKVYKRSVGYFSSGVFETITDGIVSLARNGGNIRLIASPKLSEDDIEAIKLGYEKKEHVAANAFTDMFLSELEEMKDANLSLLVDLIANEILDIKIAVANSIGDYHDKLGIFIDENDNKVAFFGSSNSSVNGYKNNYEKIRTARSWVEGEDLRVKDEEEEFDSLWNGSNPYVSTYDYKESARKNVLEVIDRRVQRKRASSAIKLRDYQEEAIAAWKANNYKGFYVMATGTGKTWTAIFSAKELLKEHKSTIVICAPYKHLVKQWEEDVRTIFSDAKIILVSSENPGWDNQISQEIIRKKYNKDNQIIIISTIASFNMERFKRAIGKSSDSKLLIVDEAHRFTDRSDELKNQYEYMLGLSATPFSGSSSEKGKLLMDFFGGQVFNLPIETALERGFLVKYNYHPVYVTATEDEEKKFNVFSRQIASCFINGVCINPDLLVRALRNRLRVISMAEQKIYNIDKFIKDIPDRDHFVVYCGDGKLFDDSTGEEIRHIQAVKRALTKSDYRSSQFTAKENMKERISLVDAFNNGEISALAAIRCLDEGINIPSIKTALILSSNDDYREFVQRRGRILRTFKDKEYADIYDVIVLPSSDMQAWAKIELRRFYEYARLADNWNDLKREFDAKLEDYNLSIDDINIYEYEEQEVELDE